MLGVGLIVLPVLVLVLTIPTWEQRTVDAQDAARAGARALVVADDWQDGALAADDAIDQVIVGDGLVAPDVTVRLAGSLEPGGKVSVAVTVLLPVGNLPGLGFVGVLHYTATSVEHVDNYRDSPS
jgi:hypothetical protein